MKISYEREDRLMLIPETEFEEEFLSRFSSKPLQTWLKHGMTGADLLGLVIEPCKEENNEI